MFRAWQWANNLATVGSELKLAGMVSTGVESRCIHEEVLRRAITDERVRYSGKTHVKEIRTDVPPPFHAERLVPTHAMSNVSILSKQQFALLDTA